MDAIESRMNAARDRIAGARPERAKLQTVAAAPKPVEPPPDTLRVYNDQSRDFQIIAYADWSQFQALGYRQLAAHERPEQLPQPRPPKVGLSLPRPAVTGSGPGAVQGIWTYQRAEIRKELYRATTALAPRVQAEPLSWERFAGKEKAPVADVYAMTILAQVVEQLAATVDEQQSRIDRLSAELAASVAAGKGN